MFSGEDRHKLSRKGEIIGVKREDPENVPYGKVSSVEEIGQIIRLKRRSLGFNQERAAALSGVGVRFLSELERGKTTSEIGKILRVLERLGVNITLTSRSGGTS